MPLYLTYCQQCMQASPELMAFIERVRCDYPDELCVIEAECLAACQSGPTVMLEGDEPVFDYCPDVSPQELLERLEKYLSIAPELAAVAG